MYSIKHSNINNLVGRETLIINLYKIATLKITQRLSGREKKKANGEKSKGPVTLPLQLVSLYQVLHTRSV